MGELASADDLFGVPPERFIAERDALVKRLRAAGERDDAARVAKLRRPTPTAWALNQTVRAEPRLIDAALDAGGRLGDATRSALQGDASRLRPAEAEARAASEVAVDAALGYLAAAGHPATAVARQRITATLRAATIDVDTAAALTAGILTTDHETPGLGLDPTDVPADLAVPSVKPRVGERSNEPRPTAASRRAETARLAGLQAAARRHRSSLDREAGRLEKVAATLQRQAREAEGRAAAARAGADGALRRAATARRAAEAVEIPI